MSSSEFSLLLPLQQYTPSYLKRLDEERVQVETQLLAVTNEIRDLESDHPPPSQLTTFRRTFKEHEDRLAELAIARIPFRRSAVPSEILSLIFERLVLDTGQSPLILLEVCRAWREVAFSTPRIWCNIKLAVVPSYHRPKRRLQDHRNRLYCANAEDVRWVLRLAKLCDLELEIPIQENYPQEMETMLMVLREHRAFERCTTLVGQSGSWTQQDDRKLEAVLAKVFDGVALDRLVVSVLQVSSDAIAAAIARAKGHTLQHMILMAFPISRFEGAGWGGSLTSLLIRGQLDHEWLQQEYATGLDVHLIVRMQVERLQCLLGACSSLEVLTLMWPEILAVSKTEVESWELPPLLLPSSVAKFRLEIAASTFPILSIFSSVTGLSINEGLANANDGEHDDEPIELPRLRRLCVNGPLGLHLLSCMSSDQVLDSVNCMVSAMAPWEFMDHFLAATWSGDEKTPLLRTKSLCVANGYWAAQTMLNCLASLGPWIEALRVDIHYMGVNLGNVWNFVKQLGESPNAPNLRCFKLEYPRMEEDWPRCKKICAETMKNRQAQNLPFDIFQCGGHHLTKATSLSTQA